MHKSQIIGAKKPLSRIAPHLVARGIEKFETAPCIAHEGMINLCRVLHSNHRVRRIGPSHAAIIITYTPCALLRLRNTLRGICRFAVGAWDGILARMYIKIC
jgi:hypothetical protein